MRLLATRPLKCNAVKAQKCQHGTDQAEPVLMPHKRRSRGLAKTYLVASPWAPAEHGAVLGWVRTALRQASGSIQHALQHILTAAHKPRVKCTIYGEDIISS